MIICIHVYVRVVNICDICTQFIYADFILLFYLWLLGQIWPNKEVKTNLSRYTRELYTQVLFLLFLLYGKKLYAICPHKQTGNDWYT